MSMMRGMGIKAAKGDVFGYNNVCEGDGYIELNMEGKREREHRFQYRLCQARARKADFRQRRISSYHYVNRLCKHQEREIEIE